MKAEELLKCIENGQLPVKEDCILHGNRLTNLEADVKNIEREVKSMDEKIDETKSQVSDLHKNLYQNGFQDKINKTSNDSAMALEKIAGLHKVGWYIIAAIISSLIYNILR